MAEVYVGTKFRTRFASPKAPRRRVVADLVRWCRRLAELGLAPAGAGNLSARTARGFVISRTAGDLASIGPGEFVEVLDADLGRREITVAGAFEPSSESLLHAAIYAARPDVKAVFHGHDDRLLSRGEELGLPVTERELPYGTPEIAAEAAKTLERVGTLVLRGHGIVWVGETPDAAGRRAEELLARAAQPLIRRRTSGRGSGGSGPIS